jgi:hypothetical protein
MIGRKANDGRKDRDRGWEEWRRMGGKAEL